MRRDVHVRNTASALTILDPSGISAGADVPSSLKTLVWVVFPGHPIRHLIERKRGGWGPTSELRGLVQMYKRLHFGVRPADTTAHNRGLGICGDGALAEGRKRASAVILPALAPEGNRKHDTIVPTA